MKNGQNLLRRISPVVIAVIVVWGFASLFDSSPAAEEIRRPDVIRIQTAARLKTLEMPPAVFLHDKHTQNVLTDGKDCTVCHEKTTPYTFLNTAGMKDAKAMEQAFHNGCLGCHQEMGAGPQDGECRICHAERPDFVRDAKEVSMGDRSLHYLHVSSRAIVYKGGVPNPEGVNCGVCHHVYDEKAGQLVWKPGAEDACASCHGKEANGSTPSLKTAMHDSCVPCHVRVGQEKTVTPAPVQKTALKLPPVAAHAFLTPEDMIPVPASWSPDPGYVIASASMKLAPGQIMPPEMRPDVPALPVIPEAEKEVKKEAGDMPGNISVQAPPRTALEPAVPVSEQPVSDARITASDAGGVEAIMEEMIRRNREREAARRELADREAAAIEAKIGTGPVSCAGCHSTEAQASWSKLSDPPRLMRGQPDATVLTPPAPEGESKRSISGEGIGMSPVVFNHLAHEEVTDSCRICHHKRISACTDCHTPEGRPEGKFVTFGDAMHTSCVGCHQQTVAHKTECAGCHVLLPKAMNNQNACTVCHQPVRGLTQAQVADGSAFALGKAKLAQIAEADIAASIAAHASATSNAAQIIAAMPEKVTIDALASEYEPSILPHRQIFQALQKGMEKDGLAHTFHGSTLATCAACHHHSPAETLATPPKCASCHGSQADTMETDENRPSLKAAYHQQCMACHDRMNITKPAATDCTGCHAARPVAGK